MRRRNLFWLICWIAFLGAFIISAIRYYVTRTHRNISNSKFPQTERLLRSWESGSSLAPKIGFLFLSTGGLEFEELWKEWFQGNEDRAMVLIHCDKTISSASTDWFIRHLTSITVQTAWGHPNLTKAMIFLLNEAFARDQQGRIAKVVFLSDKCVPLHSFDDTYRLLLADPYCWMHRTIDPLTQLAKLPKASQWIALNRDALMIAKNVTQFQYYSDMVYGRKAVEWNLLTDEFYFANLLQDYGMWVSMANRTMTWLKWAEGSSPVTISSATDLDSIKKSLLEAKRRGVLFARKFLRSSNFEALGLHNISILSNVSSRDFAPKPYVSKEGLLV